MDGEGFQTSPTARLMRTCPSFFFSSTSLGMDRIQNDSHQASLVGSGPSGGMFCQGAIRFPRSGVTLVLGVGRKSCLAHDHHELGRDSKPLTSILSVARGKNCDHFDRRAVEADPTSSSVACFHHGNSPSPSPPGHAGIRLSRKIPKASLSLSSAHQQLSNI